MKLYFSRNPNPRLAVAAARYLNAPVEFVIVPNMDHFVPWSNPELIEQAVLKMISKDHHVASQQE